MTRYQLHSFWQEVTFARMQLSALMRLPREVTQYRWAGAYLVGADAWGKIIYVAGLTP